LLEGWTFGQRVMLRLIVTLALACGLRFEQIHAPSCLGLI
jgi:hypothetical protein